MEADRLDLVLWLTEVLTGKSGDHVRTAPVDLIRAAALLHTMQGETRATQESANRFFDALEAAARCAGGDDPAEVYGDRRALADGEDLDE